MARKTLQIVRQTCFSSQLLDPPPSEDDLLVLASCKSYLLLLVGVEKSLLTILVYSSIGLDTFYIYQNEVG